MAHNSGMILRAHYRAERYDCSLFATSQKGAATRAIPNLPASSEKHHLEKYGVLPYSVREMDDAMPPANTGNEMARLEARIPARIYDQMQRAAKLRGMTLTAYLLATAGEEARREVEEADIMRLSREDQIRFAEALINPPKPSARLVRAAKRHAELIRQR